MEQQGIVTKFNTTLNIAAFAITLILLIVMAWFVFKLAIQPSKVEFTEQDRIEQLQNNKPTES